MDFAMPSIRNHRRIEALLLGKSVHIWDKPVMCVPAFNDVIVVCVHFINQRDPLRKYVCD